MFAFVRNAGANVRGDGLSYGMEGKLPIFGELTFRDMRN